MEEYKEKLIEHLRERGGKDFTRSGNYYSARCPICGDSEKSSRHHLFIRISPNDGMMLAKCFQTKCNVGYRLNNRLLYSLGVTDEQIHKAVANNYIHETFNIKFMYNTGNVKIPEPKDGVLKYFQKRTGLTKEDMFKFKVIGDIEEFFTANELDKRELEKLNLNSNNCIAFLNNGNTRLAIRKLDKKKFHYISIKKSETHLHTPIYYENKISEGMVSDFDIVVSEGLFDNINSIELNGDRPGIYCSSSSASAIYKIFKIFSKKYRDVRWVFYSDSDVPIDFYKKLLKVYGYRIRSMVVRYNMSYKDIGDKTKPISIREYVLR